MELCSLAKTATNPKKISNLSAEAEARCEVARVRSAVEQNWFRNWIARNWTAKDWPAQDWTARENSHWRLSSIFQCAEHRLRVWAAAQAPAGEAAVVARRMHCAGERCAEPGAAVSDLAVSSIRCVARRRSWRMLPCRWNARSAPGPMRPPTTRSKQTSPRASVFLRSQDPLGRAQPTAACPNHSINESHNLSGDTAALRCEELVKIKMF
jgi:hypothetical protein